MTAYRQGSCALVMHFYLIITDHTLHSQWIYLQPTSSIHQMFRDSDNCYGDDNINNQH